jgi:hypothetical protein
LPDAVEGTWYGAVAFRVGGRVFARGHENDADLFLLKVGGDERDGLVADDPSRWSVTEHRSERDESVLLRLSACAPSDLGEIAELLALARDRVMARAGGKRSPRVRPQ